MKTYKAIGLTAIICIILTSSLWYVFGATPSSTFYISSGLYPSDSTYIVWREGANYYAKNNRGQIEYDNTNCSALVENLMGNGYTLTFVGGGGNFIFDGRIFLKSNMEIKGYNNPVLTTSGGGSISTRMIFVNEHYISGTDQNIVIEGLTFNGESGSENNPLYFAYVNDLTVRGCIFQSLYGTNKAFLGLNNTNAIIENNIFRNTMEANLAAIVFEEHCNGTIIKGNTFDNITREGVYIGRNNFLFSISNNVFVNVSEAINFKYDTAFNTVTDNIFINCSYGVLMTDEASGQSYDCTFTGNSFFNMVHYAFRLRDCNSITISGNTISDSYEGVGLAQNTYNVAIVGNQINNCQFGIFIYEGVNVTCSGNIISDGKAGNSYGIKLGESATHNATWVIITGERHYNLKYGIFEDSGSGSDYNVVVGCIVTDCTTANIIISGSNSKCNLCYNGTSWIS